MSLDIRWVLDLGFDDEMCTIIAAAVSTSECYSNQSPNSEKAQRCVSPDPHARGHRVQLSRYISEKTEAPQCASGCTFFCSTSLALPVTPHCLSKWQGHALSVNESNGI